MNAITIPANFFWPILPGPTLQGDDSARRLELGPGRTFLLLLWRIIGNVGGGRSVGPMPGAEPMGLGDRCPGAAGTPRRFCRAIGPAGSPASTARSRATRSRLPPRISASGAAGC